MGKRQIKPKGSKTKMFSHRPQRAENSYYDEEDRKHYRKPELREGEWWLWIYRTLN